jgi:hypothetical protein
MYHLTNTSHMSFADYMLIYQKKCIYEIRVLEYYTRDNYTYFLAVTQSHILTPLSLISRKIRFQVPGLTVSSLPDEICGGENLDYGLLGCDAA